MFLSLARHGCVSVSPSPILPLEGENTEHINPVPRAPGGLCLFAGVGRSASEVTAGQAG